MTGAMGFLLQGMGDVPNKDNTLLLRKIQEPV
jgi:hypothetical protein